MHLSGNATRKRWATEIKTSSPAECPKLSLMFLNRSTSTNKTVGEQPLNREFSIEAPTCSIINPRFGRLVKESVCAESISRACSDALACTAKMTRAVTAAAKMKIETVRTARSVSLVGLVRANITTGTTSEVVVNTSRLSSGCLIRLTECDASVETLGCSTVAETKNKLAMYGAFVICVEISNLPD